MSMRATVLSKDYEQSRYSVPHNILRSETIYGAGFQSPGGLRGFQETLLHRMPVKPGQRLLEIGSGLGGAAFYLASAKSVEVVGVDSSNVMISLANERKVENGLGQRVTFILGDVFWPSLQHDDYDVVYSKDSLMYEAAKGRLFSRCFDLLKPGGWLCISDFCREKASAEFDQYVEVSGYHLPTIPQYVELLAEAGFVNVNGEDTSNLAKAFLERDLEGYRKRIASHPQEIAAEDAEHIIERWNRKIRFLDAKQLVQGLFLGQKRAAKG